MGLSATFRALPLSSLTDGKEGKRARREEGLREADPSVGNDDANATAGWITVACLMAVTKEEVGRRLKVEREANVSADPCWHQEANSVNTMGGFLKN